MQCQASLGTRMRSYQIKRVPADHGACPVLNPDNPCASCLFLLFYLIQYRQSVDIRKHVSLNWRNTLGIVLLGFQDL